MEDIKKQSMEKSMEWYSHIRKLQCRVSKERYFNTAMSLFGFDARKSDLLFGQFQSLLSNIPLKSYETDETKELLVLSVEVAEKSYSFVEEQGAFVPYDLSRKLKYFYKKSGKKCELAIDLTSRYDIGLLNELMSDGEVDVYGIVDYIDTMTFREEKIDFYEGDIVLTYSDVTDHIFYDYYHSDDLGVFVATKHGWRKLFYTPHRGYLKENGEPDIQDETKYSDYMIAHAGRKYRFVGNLHKDSGVLVEK